MQASEQTGGIFDVTCAPLINQWGFGFTKFDSLTPQLVDIIRHFKSLGANIHTEATPHHFTLTAEAVLTYGTLAKMNPPLRTEADRQAIIRGLQDGTIDLIATDHAPHADYEKAKPLTEAPSGIIGLPAVFVDKSLIL